MLAQNFKSAADLGITEPQLSALQKTLVLLETGKLTHIRLCDIKERWLVVGDEVFTGGFNMHVVLGSHDCGTAGCIYGTAKLISGEAPPLTEAALALYCGNGRPEGRTLDSLTPEESATALRSYLTTGDARWDLAVA